MLQQQRIFIKFCVFSSLMTQHGGTGPAGLTQFHFLKTLFCVNKSQQSHTITSYTLCFSYRDWVYSLAVIMLWLAGVLKGQIPEMKSCISDSVKDLRCVFNICLCTKI